MYFRLAGGLQKSSVSTVIMAVGLCQQYVSNELRQGEENTGKIVRFSQKICLNSSAGKQVH